MQTERDTETEQEVVAEQPDPIAEKFHEQEKRFLELEDNIAVLRRFIVVHHDALAPFTWTAWGWDKSIEFRSYSQRPTEIAKAFGKDGWRRESDSYSCGSINWKKELDGVKLKIEAAENIKPTLREEVKFSGE